MKIDYELVEKIGATHYYKLRRGGYVLINIDSAKLTNINARRFDIKQFISVNDDGSISDTYSVSASLKFLLSNAKPIPPKPPVRVEYEKVTDSIFDLKDEFERGELYKPMNDGSYEQITGDVKLCDLFGYGLIYRRIEKPVDWRDVLCQNQVGITPRVIEGAEIVEIDEYFNKEQAIELARDILQATGEM